MTTGWDVFISHASEDKEFARSLATRLSGVGLRVWFDEFELRLGDSLRNRIDDGLSRSHFGLVVVSPIFLQKQWPKRELNALFAREVDDETLILPVLHNLSIGDLAKISPLLADRLSVSSEGGMDAVVVRVLQAIRRRSGGYPASPHFEFSWSSKEIRFVLLPARAGDLVLFMGKHPITNEQYRGFAETEPDWGGEPVGRILKDGVWRDGFRPWRTPGFAEPDKPVVCVTYNNALFYTYWMIWQSGGLESNTIAPGDASGVRFFVPSAELWDFAALGTWARATSDPALWLSRSEQVHHMASGPADIDRTGRRQNPFGISDMFGNVWEWCADVGRIRHPLFRSGLYDEGAVPDLRGGGFNDDLRATNVFLSGTILEQPALTKHFDVGFRLAASAPLSMLPVDVQAALADCLPAPESALRAPGNGMNS